MEIGVIEQGTFCFVMLAIDMGADILDRYRGITATMELFFSGSTRHSGDALDFNFWYWV